MKFWRNFNNFLQCIKQGLAVVIAEYLPVEKNLPNRSLRITVNRLFTDENIDQAYKILETISKAVCNEY